ncbi:MAG: Metallophosphoesterase [Acidobacteriota bacterium]|nr:Metallophosphoesterase [Acidobacteriota bacterium]
MFLFLILTVYFLPTIYTYVRLKKLFSRRLYRILFTLCYIIFALGFFIAEILSHRVNIGAGPARYIILIGYYTLPYMLYLFLMTLASDILRGVNRLLKIVPAETTGTRKFQAVTTWILFLLPALIVAFGAVHVNSLKVNEYHVTIPRKSAVINHLKIVMSADFHLGQITDKEFLGKFTHRVNALSPDIVLLPGDIVEGHRDDGETSGFAQHFHQIKSKYGIYASPGNHESHNRGNKLKFFADAGINVLADAVVTIDNSFYLVGRNDARSNTRESIEELLKQTPNNLPVILLDHRPTDIKEVSRHDVDIQLSGHTHNGQLFPLNFIINNLYELGWGHKKFENTHLFVTSGAQVWGPPVRTAGNSEIMVINVDFAFGDKGTLL